MRAASDTLFTLWSGLRLAHAWGISVKPALERPGRGHDDVRNTRSFYIIVSSPPPIEGRISSACQNVGVFYIRVHMRGSKSRCSTSSGPTEQRVPLLRNPSSSLFRITHHPFLSLSLCLIYHLNKPQSVLRGVKKEKKKGLPCLSPGLSWTSFYPHRMQIPNRTPNIFPKASVLDSQCACAPRLCGHTVKAAVQAVAG